MSDFGSPPKWPTSDSPSSDDTPLPAAKSPLRRRLHLSSRQRVLGVAIVIGALIAALIYTNVRITNRPDVTTGAVNRIANKSATNAVGELQSQPPTATTVYDEVADGLVLIQAQDSKNGGELGTGFLVDKKGDIMTALHVVKGASSIHVTFSNGMQATATIATADPAHDIAVLITNKSTTAFTPETLGGTAQIGASVYAVGNPLGLLGSLSTGVVSGLDRTFPIPHGRTLTGMIQFDAAVNPGNSGGPLLNAKGQVIGVVNGLVNPTGADSFAGIAFAVPIATAGQAAGEPAK